VILTKTDVARDRVVRSLVDIVGHFVLIEPLGRFRRGGPQRPLRVSLMKFEFCTKSDVRLNVAPFRLQ